MPPPQSPTTVITSGLDLDDVANNRIPSPNFAKELDLSSRKHRAATLRSRYSSISTRSIDTDSTSCASSSSERTCYGQNPHEPSIADFLKATGQNVDEMSSEELIKYTDRNLIRISSRWAELVAEQNDSEDEAEESYVAASLTTDCAKLEVEAINVLSQLEATHITNEEDEANNILPYDSDDDDMREELRELNSKERLLKMELMEAELSLRSERKQDDATVDRRANAVKKIRRNWAQESLKQSVPSKGKTIQKLALESHEIRREMDVLENEIADHERAIVSAPKEVVEAEERLSRKKRRLIGKLIKRRKRAIQALMELSRRHDVEKIVKLK